MVIMLWVLKLGLGVVAGLLFAAWLVGLRYIPHNKVGIVEKWWASQGSLTEGRIIALQGEAGFQAEILRGGLHWFYFPWQYRVHKEPLVMIAESKIGYVYSRDGAALKPMQTLGRVTECNNYQNARAFLTGGGQRGRQRDILREGVYAINLAQFVVITETSVFCGPIPERDARKYHDWQAQLASIRGFDPVVVGGGADRPEDSAEIEAGEQMHLMDQDTIGIVTVHDGSPLDSGEIIAPEVKATAGQSGHNYFQDPEAFLALGGRRGKQLQVLTDGTFFVNRWFATIEFRQKTLIPIGYVGVVVSYYGVKGEDVTGDHFRYGEQVEAGHQGVWKRAIPPGKYALNPYALTVEMVPTVNFVLRWITGSVEEHEYDKELKSIEIITADGYEPLLPLSLVVHIDYEKAPRVVQRFGDVKRLISQTLDPILSAYFRDVAQSTQMLDLLTRREEIQRQATEELGRRFQDYDINCIAVLIGRPESQGSQYEAGDDPIEKLFDQLRMRRLAEEQIVTYAKKEQAAMKLKELNNAEAIAEKQRELSQTKIDIEISGNRGEAQLAESKRLAERDVVRAEGESRSKEIMGRGEGRAKELLGKGEASRISETGLAEAAVFMKKIQAYGDPRLFALNLVSEKIAGSQQPLVPERLFLMGPAKGDGAPNDSGTTGLFGQLLALLVAEKTGLGFNATPGPNTEPTASGEAA